jgi:hypothetical protein
MRRRHAAGGEGERREDRCDGLVDTPPMVQGVAGQEADAPRRTAEPAALPLLLFAVFAAVSLVVYRSALHGPFLSDDFGYIVSNPYTSGLGWANLRAILDPFGPRVCTRQLRAFHLLLTALERQIR